MKLAIKNKISAIPVAVLIYIVFIYEQSKVDSASPLSRNTLESTSELTLEMYKNTESILYDKYSRFFLSIYIVGIVIHDSPTIEFLSTLANKTSGM